MATMNVSLTAELMAIVQAKVKSGLYNNASEVIREAIRHLDTNENLLIELKRERLRKALSSGIKQAKSRQFASYSVQELLSEVDK